MLISTILQAAYAQKAAETFTLQLNTQLISGQARHSVLNAGVWRAVDEINADPKLPNVNVNTTNYYTWDEVTPSVRLSVNAFMQAIQSNNPGHVIIGPPYSSQAVPMSANAEAFDIPVVSYLATAPSLSDKSRYPYFSRVLTSDASIGTGFANYFVSQNFKRVAAIVENSDYGLGLQEAFVREATRLGLSIDFIAKVDTPESMNNTLKSFRASAARVIVAMGGSDTMSQMSIVAYDAGFMGPKSAYLWTFTSDILLMEPTFEGRNLSEILCGNIYLSERVGDLPYPITPLMNAMNDSLVRHEGRGFTKAAWDNRSTQYYTYAAVKLAAYATQLMIDDLGRNMSLFTFRGSTFNSGSQNVTIGENGDPLSDRFDVGNFRIEPVTGGFYFIFVETYGPTPGDPKRKMMLYDTFAPIIYPDGTSKNTFEPPTISLADQKEAVGTFFTLVAVLCVLFVGSMFFIISNKDIVILKITSWYINSFILMSLCLIVLSTIPTYMTPNYLNCTSRVLVFSFGFTFIGSLLFLKNYRVWRIFCSKKMDQRFILSDKQILLFSLGICLADS
jgi:ABC-type branched-subunit amino acid transport system substrate-binding protein